MKSPLKNKIKKSSMKIVSVLVVIFLVSTAASTAVSKMDFSKAEEILNDEPEQVITIKEKLSGFTQTLKDIIDRIRDLKDFLRGEEDEEGNTVTPQEALRTMSTGSSSLQFYTNYNGHVEETTLKIFRETGSNNLSSFLKSHWLIMITHHRYQTPFGQLRQQPTFGFLGFFQKVIHLSYKVPMHKERRYGHN